jgi:hypothetical protein
MHDDVIKALSKQGLSDKEIHERLNNTHRECTLNDVQSVLKSKPKAKAKSKK